MLLIEMEVTAEKKSAKLLAQVAFNFLDTIDGFVFLSKLIQRIGGWPIPMVIPPRDRLETMGERCRMEESDGVQV